MENKEFHNLEPDQKATLRKINKSIFKAKEELRLFNDGIIDEDIKDVLESALEDLEYMISKFDI